MIRRALRVRIPFPGPRGSAACAAAREAGQAARHDG